jgi:cation diffusion facilitator family transporter
MKAAWVEDLLSLVPPLAFLVAARYQDRPPNPKFPYGYRRAMSISFLITATALLSFGLFLLFDSVLSLVNAEHPTVGTREILGVQVWSGWLMIGALVYSMIPPLILGRMKLPLSRELHEKTLHADADMNKADWLTGGAGVVGVLGIGIGWWWADAVAAGVIALDITRDGVANLKSVIEDLMDRRPMSVDRKEVDPLPDRARRELEKLPWVELAAIRLREEGQVLVGEAFVVASDASDLPAKLVRASETVQALHWRLHEVVVTAVPSLEPPD